MPITRSLYGVDPQEKCPKGKEKRRRFSWWLRARRFSPSKLTIALSDYTAILWLCLLFSTVPAIQDSRLAKCPNLIPVAFIVFSVIYLTLVWYWSNSSDDSIRSVISLSESSPALKAKLGEALKLKGVWDVQLRDFKQVAVDIARISADQDRIRKNLRETPKEAEVYGDYLKKLSAQEKEMDALTEKQKKLLDSEYTTRKAYEDFLGNLSD